MEEKKLTTRTVHLDSPDDKLRHQYIYGEDGGREGETGKFSRYSLEGGNNSGWCGGLGLEVY